MSLFRSSRDASRFIKASFLITCRQAAEKFLPVIYDSHQDILMLVARSNSQLESSGTFPPVAPAWWGHHAEHRAEIAAASERPKSTLAHTIDCLYDGSE
jgi:hypothetical protein